MFAGIFARGGAAAEVGDRAWLQAMLDFEAALARACARNDLIPEEAAEAIAAACSADRFDVAAIGRAAADSAQPVVPLVGALRDAVGPDASGHVHHGATSQDTLDSAAMLVAKRALGPILEDAAAAAVTCAQLAERYADTPIMGRTLLQQALPTTFGAKAAAWLAGIDDARGALGDVRDRDLAVQLGGPVGDLSSFGDAGPRVAADVADELGLARAAPWHAVRNRVVRLAGALGVLAGAAGKVGRDVTLLAQQEVGEAREGGEGRGGSSSMPHKRNPVAAISAVACALRVPGLVGTMQAAMVGEHERSAGAWQSEWETLTDLLRLTGSATAWLRDLLERLEVDADRMRANAGG